VILARKPLAERDRDRVALRFYTALDCFSRGVAGREEWHDCADAINLVEALCEVRKLEGALMGAVARAINGMANAIKVPAGRMFLEGVELQALQAIVTAYDEALGRLSQGTIADAQAAVVVKIAQHRENPERGGVTVVEP
jgi:hypothetical protein